jgi:hypothetical protein
VYPHHAFIHHGWNRGVYVVLVPQIIDSRSGGLSLDVLEECHGTKGKGTSESQSSMFVSENGSFITRDRCQLG